MTVASFKKNILYILAITACWLLVFAIVGTKSASATVALNPNPQGGATPLPTNWYNYLTGCDSRGFSPSLVQWVSPTNDTTTYTVTVPQGTTNIPLRFNYAGAVCYTNSLVSAYHLNVSAATSNNGASVANLINPKGTGTGSGLSFSPYNQKGRYDQDHVDFNFNKPGGFTSGVYNIALTYEGINTRVVSPTYDCTRTGGPPINPGTATNFAKCPHITVGFRLQVTVKVDTPPIISAGINCTKQTFNATSGDKDYNGSNNGKYSVQYVVRNEDGSVVLKQGDLPTPWRGLNPLTTHNFDMTTVPGFSQSNIYRIYVSTRGIQYDGNWGKTRVSLDDDSAGRWPNDYILYDCTPDTFNLDQSVTTNLNDDESPTQVTIAPLISHDDGLAVNNIQWTVKAWIDHYGGGITSLPGYPKTNNSFDMPGATNYDFGGGYYEPVSGLKAGDKVCATLLVTPLTGTVKSDGTIITSTPNAIATVPSCDFVVDKPYVKFLGNDLFVGGDFGSSSCSDAAGVDVFSRKSGSNYLGSSTQFAGYVMGQITGLSTANLSGSNVSPPTDLSFSNQSGVNLPTQDYGGNLGGINCVKDYFGGAPASSGTLSAKDISTLGSGQYTYKASGNLKLTGNVANGKHLFIYVDGNVYIPSSLTFSSILWSSEKDIPALYVIASGDIYIDGSVSQLDGVYVAQSNAAGDGGTIYTCAQATGPYDDPTNGGSAIPFLPGGDCNKKTLTVYGTFLADQIKLLRTKNSLRNSKPGESFNPFSPNISSSETFIFSPETYLSNVCSDITSLCPSSQQDEGITSLPPIL